MPSTYFCSGGGEKLQDDDTEDAWGLAPETSRPGSGPAASLSLGTTLSLSESKFTHPKHNETFICQRAAEKIRMRDWFIDSVENSLDTY